VVSELEDTAPRTETATRTRLLDAASRRGRQVHQSTGFDVIVGVGLVTYGIVHLLIAWIAVRIAWTGRGNDSQDAALAALAETVYGETLLWITTAGLAALTLWQIFETIYRGGRRSFVDDLKDSVSARVIILGQAGFIGKGITFAIIGVLMIVTGFDGRTGPPGLQAVLRLLNLSPAGGVLLVLKAIGLALFGVYCFAWAANRRR
jgi:hypothetical protein